MPRLESCVERTHRSAYSALVRDSAPVYLYQAPSGGCYYRYATDADAKNPIFKTQAKRAKPDFWTPTKGPFAQITWRTGLAEEAPAAPDPLWDDVDRHLSLFV